jgi:hypothetical protein
VSRCKWSIRPFTDQTQVSCELSEHLQPEVAEGGQALHQATLRDYAYPGSATVITWYAGDRREFEGNFPGYCTKLGMHAGRQNCTLPAGHRGKCAP